MENDRRVSLVPLPATENLIGRWPPAGRLVKMDVQMGTDRFQAHSKWRISINHDEKTPRYRQCLIALHHRFGQLLWCAGKAPRHPTRRLKSLHSFVDNHTLGGAVLLVASKDNILSFEATGYADVAAKTPMRKNSLFWIASMSKAITTTALMMMVEEGKVKLDDPVTKYLPEFASMMVGEGKDRTTEEANPSDPRVEPADPHQRDAEGDADGVEPDRPLVAGRECEDLSHVSVAL